MPAYRWLLLCCMAAFAAPQDPAPDLRFEVASIKPAAPAGGGAATSDPGRISYPRITLKALLAKAYNLDPEQIRGPQWIGADTFALNATLPPDATKSDVAAMLRNLLGDRFHLVAHTETTTVSGYELLVAKSGPKIRASDNSPTDPGADGFQVPAKGLKYQANFANGVEKATFRDTSMAEFIQTLRFDGTQALGGTLFLRPNIIDKTDLTGTYSFRLEFRRKFDDPDTDSPDLFTALEKQLGLRLLKTTMPLEVLVVDKTDRTPVEN